ncbi:G-type lectin S-receptor-like serine/threonine-protein kinase RKS1 [Camellia lanceoleosa]|uniref:G-type lectin S-receptor-like serine/threonine-protein kinase RKS1 n=1 Tax=Camellia lanceoleosa TaxID=1840588 RepID=A0ACC0FIM8_9ERIC|nr:G-type lectin S-receptor-like serine/threonine-protein kinase RKS1 [Camellia lanceoleosa]
MTTPYYNSRATKIAVVTNGEGYFEMACPHLSSSEFGGSGSNRGRQEGAEDRTSSNAGAVAQATRKSKYIDDPEEVSIAYDQVIGSSLSKFFLDELVGGLKMDTWVDVEGQGHGEWVEFYSAPNEPCDNYGRCGAYGYCDESKLPAGFECTCLPGHEPKSAKQWNLRDATGGCVEKKHAGLGTCGNGEGFVKVERAKIPDTSWARVAPQLSMNECEARCLMNCSCKAYSSVADLGNCITWYGDLIDKKKSISEKAIVVTSVVVMLALIISLVCWLVMKKARRDVGFNNQASDDEKLELPIFDMITIAAATNQFSDTNKIGEGGFGPVYKVCLFHCSIVS